MCATCARDRPPLHRRSSCCVGRRSRRGNACPKILKEVTQKGARTGLGVPSAFLRLPYSFLIATYALCRPCVSSCRDSSPEAQDATAPPLGIAAASCPSHAEGMSRSRPDRNGSLTVRSECRPGDRQSRARPGSDTCKQADEGTCSDDIVQESKDASAGRSLVRM